MALAQVINIVLQTGVFRTVNLLYVVDRAVAVLTPFYYRNVLTLLYSSFEQITAALVSSLHTGNRTAIHRWRRLAPFPLAANDRGRFAVDKRRVYQGGLYIAKSCKCVCMFYFSAFVCPYVLQSVHFKLLNFLSASFQ